jgi:hypothetical protein
VPAVKAPTRVVVAVVAIAMVVVVLLRREG